MLYWLRPERKEKPPEKTTLTGAERSQRWRDNLKKNPESYKEWKRLDALRKKLSRMQKKKNLSEDERERIRAANRERQKRFRQRRKSLGQEYTKQPKRQILTRKEAEKQRAYWKEKQRESRERRTSQKIRRKKEKDRAYVRNKRNASEKEHPDRTPEECTMSEYAVRKAVQRAKLPKKPDNFADAVQYIIKTSPHKRQALEEKGVIGTKNDKCDKKIIEILKDQLRQKKMKKSILPALKVMKKYKMLKTTALNLGVHSSSLSRITDGPRKSRIDHKAEKEVHDFLNSNSIPLPDRKSVKRNEPEGRKVLDRPLKSVYVDYKESGGNLGFSTFAKKVPSNIQTCSKQPWYSCLCEYCTNVDLKIKALNDFANKVKMVECKLLDRYHAVNLTLCDKADGSSFHHRKCVERNCEDCNKDLLVSHFTEILSRHGHEMVDYTIWEKQDGELNKKGKKTVRVMMVKKKESLNAMIIKLADHVDRLANHLFVARWQQKQFTQLVNNIPPDWVVLNLDFAENYSCISQMEIQTAHWGHNQVTIHPIVSYYNCNKDQCELTNHVQETLLFISNDLKHDSHAVNCFIQKANEYLKTTRSLNIAKVVQFCDGCAGQYKSCIPFCDISYSMEDFGFVTERNFYGSRHGKGPSDGAGAVIKSAARRAVNSQKEVINSAKDLAEFAERTLTKDDEPNTHTHRKRTIFYVASSEIDRNRQNRNSKTVPGTRTLHSIRSGEQPRKITARHLSCFCSHCKDSSEPGDCENAEFIDHFQVIEIQRADEVRGGRRVRNRGGARTRGGENGPRRNNRAGGVRTRGGARTRGCEKGARRNNRAGGVRTRGGARTRSCEKGARRNNRAGGARTRGGGRIRGCEKGARRNNRAGGVRTRNGERGSRDSGREALSESDSSEEQYEISDGMESSSEEQSLNDLEEGELENNSKSEEELKKDSTVISSHFEEGATSNKSNSDDDSIVNNSHSDEDLMDISGFTGIFESLEPQDQDLLSSPVYHLTGWDQVVPYNHVPKLTLMEEPDLEAMEKYETLARDSTPRDKHFLNVTDKPIPQSMLMEEPIHKPTLTEEPVLQPMLLEEPVHKPTLTEEPVLQPTLTEEPVHKPTLTEEPIPQPMLMEEPVLKPTLTEIPIPQPMLLEEPVLKPTLTEEPIPQPMLLEEPVLKLTLMEEPILQPMLMEEPVLKPTLTEEPIPQPMLLEEPVLKLTLMEEPILQPMLMEEPVLKPTLMEEPIPQPMLMEEPVLKPTLTEEPIPQPMLMEEPVLRPTLTEEPISQPMLMEEPVLKSTLMEEPFLRPAPTEEPVLKPTSAEEHTPQLVKKSYQDGTYIKVQHGTVMFPAVVDRWPWVNYFHPVRGHPGHWQLQETRHTVLFEDAVGTLPPPDLAMCGRRFFYIFKGAFDLLVYTDKDVEVPSSWGEDGPHFIANSEEVRLRSFSTSIHKLDTMVAYKKTD